MEFKTNPDWTSYEEVTEELLKLAEEEEVTTMVSRASHIKPCPIGLSGACCWSCYLGPCRLTAKKDGAEPLGVCGADRHTVAARKLARAVAAGTAAHSDHARDLAKILLGVAKGEISGFEIKDHVKLLKVAEYMEVDVTGKDINTIAKEVAEKALGQFGQQEGFLLPTNRAPKKTQERWDKWGIRPRGIDREVAETLHRTTMGTDQEPLSIMKQAMRTALADGWGGAMLGTDISDIIFGTPHPKVAKTNMGVFKEDQVNVVVHGHEPSVSEMIVLASYDPEIQAYAKEKGAKGINLSGICCTSNEILMRHGIPPAGGFISQELALITGAVDGMVVDVQCVVQALAPLAKKYGTALMTTSEKAQMPDTLHIPLEKENAVETAKKILRVAIDNFPNRKGRKLNIPSKMDDIVAGFSHEYIRYMQGGTFRGSFRPLNDAIMDGRIFGIAGFAGCDNPRAPYNNAAKMIRELIAHDVLVVTTGCGAIASGRFGLLTPEAMEWAGPGLREVCEAVGIPPVLHLGSCVDNTRILTIASEMASEGGLSDEIGGMPAVGLAPEWMSEKALAIGLYFVASGVPIIFGSPDPISNSDVMEKLLREDLWEPFRAGFYFENDPAKMVEMTLDMIGQARKELGIDKARERVLFDMAARRALEDERCHLG